MDHFEDTRFEQLFDGLVEQVARDVVAAETGWSVHSEPFSPETLRVVVGSDEGDAWTHHLASVRRKLLDLRAVEPDAAVAAKFDALLASYSADALPALSPWTFYVGPSRASGETFPEEVRLELQRTFDAWTPLLGRRAIYLAAGHLRAVPEGIIALPALLRRWNLSPWSDGRAELADELFAAGVIQFDASRAATAMPVDLAERLGRQMLTQLKTLRAWDIVVTTPDAPACADAFAKALGRPLALLRRTDDIPAYAFECDVESLRGGRAILVVETLESAEPCLAVASALAAAGVRLAAVAAVLDARPGAQGTPIASGLPLVALFRGDLLVEHALARGILDAKTLEPTLAACSP